MIKKVLLISIVILTIANYNYSQSMDGFIEWTAAINGITQGFQAHYNTLHANGDSEFSSNWHHWQFANVTTAMAGGILVGVNNFTDKTNWKGLISDVLIFSAIRWVTSSWIYNINQGNDILYISSTSGAWTDNFNWWFRLAYLAGAIIFKYIL